jgi:hypothetical protein
MLLQVVEKFGYTYYSRARGLTVIRSYRSPDDVGSNYIAACPNHRTSILALAFVELFLKKWVSKDRKEYKDHTISTKPVGLFADTVVMDVCVEEIVGVN